MRITVDFVPHARIPNQQLDHWTETDEGLEFFIANTGNDVYNRILLLHAIIEQLISEAWGVSGDTITTYDANHLDSQEPGDNPDAPYRDAHSIAIAVERIILAKLGLSWVEYERALS